MKSDQVKGASKTSLVGQAGSPTQVASAPSKPEANRPVKVAVATVGADNSSVYRLAAKRSGANFICVILGILPTGLKAVLTGEDLSNLKLKDICLPCANLAGTNFVCTDLNGALLFRANLSEADFTKAKLAGAVLVKANLAKADFTKADLRNADLSGANLQNADFTGANLEGAEFAGANLEGAILLAAKSERALNLDLAKTAVI